MSNAINSLTSTMNAIFGATIAGINCAILGVILLVLGSCVLCCLASLVQGTGAY